MQFDKLCLAHVPLSREFSQLPMQSYLLTRLLLANRRRLWGPVTWLLCMPGTEAAMYTSGIGISALCAVLLVLHLLVSLPAYPSLVRLSEP